MTTIWFKLQGTSGALSTEVNQAFAQAVWDNLAAKFEMVSSRP